MSTIMQISTDTMSTWSSNLESIERRLHLFFQLTAGFNLDDEEETDISEIRVILRRGDLAQVMLETLDEINDVRRAIERVARGQVPGV